MNIKVIMLIAAFIIIVIYVSFDSEKKRKAKLLKKLKDSWGKPSKRKITQEEYEIISHYFKDSITEDLDYIDDITWQDLNMNEVFRVMNTTNSSAGQEYLYKMLRMPYKGNEELKKLNRLVKFFSENEKKRIEIQKSFAKLGFTKYISLSDYISLIVELKADNNIVHYILLLLYAAAIITCFIIPAVGIGSLVILVIISILSYYKIKAKVESYFICITQIVKMVNAANEIAGYKNEELKDYNNRLNELSSFFNNVVKNSWLLESGNVNGSIAEMFLDYIRMLTHVDLIKFNSMVNKLGEKEKEVYELMDVLGFIESSIAIASFRKMLPYWSEPEFVSESAAGIYAEEVYHPLIAKPVSNSLNAKKHILLTGSNASGKSTFLRTIAINAILSQGIDTSMTKMYKAPRFRIFSSMSLVDDLSNNNSYYIVEIKSLKRIIDASCKSGRPVLCFVDEVLRGTNTVERIAASSEILKFISDKNVLCFAATHDIELTAILQKYYDNYHFQEKVTDDDVKFNYKLFKGPATTRNAIKLLNIIGYDKDIIVQAEKQAGYFIENGIWKM